MTKVLAFYLPQYHTFKENDEWWGKGFTEWTNVKRGKPLFWKHYQPHKPYQGNYYNLLEQDVMQKQAVMARKYGVDGFCFYHYWFDGKKLMHKPLENLLNNKLIDISYCFSWANEPWTRTWDGDKGAKQVLISQTYGQKEDWEKHFYYLLPFFQDERYIKVDNKPVFLVYRAATIPCCNEMINYWDELAKANGFQGVHFVSMVSGLEKQYKTKGFEAIADFEPNTTCRKMPQLITESKLLKRIPIIRKSMLPIFDYDEICMNMIERNYKHKSAYYGMFVGFDNTARRGVNATRIVIHNTPKRFEKYFEIQYAKSVKENKAFIFINAWNEWGEGCHLEPDEKYGFGYLNAIKRVKKRLKQNHKI